KETPKGAARISCLDSSQMPVRGKPPRGRDRIETAVGMPTPMPIIPSRQRKMPCHFFGGRVCYAGSVKTLTANLTEKEMTSAWKRRDASYDGVFFFGVKTTG